MQKTAPRDANIGDVLNANSACPSCGSWSAHIIADKDGKTNQKLISVSCSQCGLGRIDPLPTDQELADWYANQYRQLYKSSVQPALRHVLRAGRNALMRWQWLSQNSVGLDPAQNKETKRSLDIGSSSVQDSELLNNPYLLATEAQASATKVFMNLKYFILLMYPYAMSSDYSYNVIPYQEYTDISVILSILLLIGSSAGFFIALKKRSWLPS